MKTPKTFETSETSENVQKFSSEGHATPILRGMCGAAAPWPAPWPPPRPRRSSGAAAAAATVAAVAAAEKSFDLRIGKVT